MKNRLLLALALFSFLTANTMAQPLKKQARPIKQIKKIFLENEHFYHLVKECAAKNYKVAYQVPGFPTASCKEKQKGLALGDVFVCEPFFWLETIDFFKVISVDSSLTLKSRHIFFKEGEDQEANMVFDKLKAGEKFEDLALKYSQDPGSREIGGNLGVHHKGDFIKAFEEAIIQHPVGEPFIVKSTLGTHIAESLVQPQIKAKYTFIKLTYYPEDKKKGKKEK